MKTLFTTQPAYGHFHPLVPLALALQSHGHEVAVATNPSFAPVVERSNLPWIAAGLDWLEEGGGLARHFPELRDMTGQEGNEHVVGEIFGHLTALEMARDLTKQFAEWRPDVIVRETFEFGGALAAEMSGLPHATIQVGSFAAMERWRGFATKGLAKARLALGLPEDPNLEMLYRHLLLSFVPPGFQAKGFPLPATARTFQAQVFDRSAGGDLPSWLADLPEQPLVLMTMGTVLHRTLPLYEVAVEALAPLALNLTLAIGNHNEPSELERVAPNVKVERYVPLSLLLPHCDLVVNHGGFGTVLASLYHGLPMVLIPRHADQHDNARRCAELGVARVIENDEPSTADLREATVDVLHSPSYRQRALAIRDEMLALPDIDAAVEALEQLVGDKNMRIGGIYPEGGTSSGLPTIP